MYKVWQYDTGVLEKFTFIKIACAISFSYFDISKNFIL
jgi:hypothetical protein